MQSKNFSINVKTNNNEEMIDVTISVDDILKASEVKNGLIHLFVPHTTAGITINENADSDVKDDILLGLKMAFPNRKEFQHFEGNSHAHIKSSLVGCSQSIIIENGKLKLGRWQGIYFCEFDGPRNRKLYIQIIGD